MANSLSYASSYLNVLDKLFKAEATTGILEADEYRLSQNDAKTVYLREVSVQGLGDYNRGTGYQKGNATVGWRPYTLTMDRGRSFDIDAVDVNECQTSAGELMNEVMRTQVIPEVDAYRYSKIVSTCNVDVGADLSYDTAIEALEAGFQVLADREVPKDQIIFVSNTFMKYLKTSGEFYNTRVVSQNNGIINREIMSIDQRPLIPVPVERFKTAFTFIADGEGGFLPAVGAKEINFMIVPRSCVSAVIKHVAPKMIPPANNLNADAWFFAYRLYHDLFVPENKKAGIYIHTKA